jgi:hypothetical protein
MAVRQAGTRGVATRRGGLDSRGRPRYTFAPVGSCVLAMIRVLTLDHLC